MLQTLKEYSNAACSSSLAALDDAVDDIKSGRIDYAMVGGSSAILDPSFTSAFVKFGMLSPEGQCRSFDASGHGYVRADGVVVSSQPPSSRIP
jgi:fatty acid synthase, animal type